MKHIDVYLTKFGQSPRNLPSSPLVNKYKEIGPLATKKLTKKLLELSQNCHQRGKHDPIRRQPLATVALARSVMSPEALCRLKARCGLGLFLWCDRFDMSVTYCQHNISKSYWTGKREEWALLFVLSVSFSASYSSIIPVFIFSPAG